MTQAEVDAMLAQHDREDAQANARIEAAMERLREAKRKQREVWAANPDVFDVNGNLIPRKTPEPMSHPENDLRKSFYEEAQLKRMKAQLHTPRPKRWSGSDTLTILVVTIVVVGIIIALSFR